MIAAFKSLWSCGSRPVFGGSTTLSTTLLRNGKAKKIRRAVCLYCPIVFSVLTENLLSFNRRTRPSGPSAPWRPRGIATTRPSRPYVMLHHSERIRRGRRFLASMYHQVAPRLHDHRCLLVTGTRAGFLLSCHLVQFEMLRHLPQMFRKYLVWEIKKADQ